MALIYNYITILHESEEFDIIIILLFTIFRLPLLITNTSGVI